MKSQQNSPMQAHGQPQETAQPAGAASTGSGEATVSYHKRIAGQSTAPLISNPPPIALSPGHFSQ